MATSASDLTLYRYKCTNKGYVEDLGDGVTLRLMLIPSGEFMMGSLEEEPGSNNDEHPQHLVRVSKFLMGCYTVTQSQWRVVARYEREKIAMDPNLSEFKGDSLPVDSVPWEQATEFCQRLSKRTGKNYGLPSEAQWEYACRAGTEAAYHFGPQLKPELANYGKNMDRTTVVGDYPSNLWGLHDMHGNVREWCADCWHENYEGAPTDGSAWVEDGNSSLHVLRGGSWDYVPWYCRSAYRDYYNPVNRFNYTGFRAVCLPFKAS